jgi:hypothetical protein
MYGEACISAYYQTLPRLTPINVHFAVHIDHQTGPAHRLASIHLWALVHPMRHPQLHPKLLAQQRLVRAFQHVAAYHLLKSVALEPPQRGNFPFVPPLRRQGDAGGEEQEEDLLMMCGFGRFRRRFRRG